MGWRGGGRWAVQNVLHHTATHCRIMQRTVARRNIMQHTAICVRQSVHTSSCSRSCSNTQQHVSATLLLQQQQYMLQQLLKELSPSTWLLQCNTWQNSHTTTHGNSLLHTATHCNTLQIPLKRRLQCPRASCPLARRLLLQHTAAHCNTLYQIATHYNTLH